MSNTSISYLCSRYNSLTALTEYDLSGLENLKMLMLHSNSIHSIGDRSFQDLKTLQVNTCLPCSFNAEKKTSCLHPDGPDYYLSQEHTKKSDNVDVSVPAGSEDVLQQNETNQQRDVQRPEQSPETPHGPQPHRVHQPRGLLRPHQSTAGSPGGEPSPADPPRHIYHAETQSGVQGFLCEEHPPVGQSADDSAS